MVEKEIQKTLNCSHTTSITFADGKEMIIYTDGPLTDDEIFTLSTMTSDDFKTTLMATMRFQMCKIT